LKITTTDQAVQNSGMKCLIYGRAGMGKTSLAASAEAPLIISAESGLLSVRRFRIPVVEVKSLKDVIEVYQWARSSREAAQFATLFLDRKWYSPMPNLAKAILDKHTGLLLIRGRR
jgi:replication-associated recombination protein RarA